MIVIHKYVPLTKSVKHHRFKPRPGIGMVLAHLKYIQHRPGEDKEKFGRKFFDQDGKETDVKEIRQLIKKFEGGKNRVHMLTFSPEINLENKKALVKEIMDKLSADKGQDLIWFAVEHNNTDHYHVHMILMGRDKEGKWVHLSREEHEKLRQYGDEYLTRNHPVEMQFAKEKEKERKAALNRSKEELRQQRIRDGLELPWLHKKIIREQYEPYTKWKERKRQEKLQRIKDRKDPTVRKPGAIRSAGRYWTKENTLDELRELNDLLWARKLPWLSPREYDKLVAWIHEKERIEKGLQPTISKSRDGEIEEIIVNGKKYSEKSTYEELRKLSAYTHEDKKNRLPLDEYNAFRGWMENADRARFQNTISAQIEKAKVNFDREEKERFDPDNNRAPGSVPGGVPGAMFGPVAAAGRLAFYLMKFFDCDQRLQLGGDSGREEPVYKTHPIGWHNYLKGYGQSGPSGRS